MDLKRLYHTLHDDRPPSLDRPPNSPWFSVHPGRPPQNIFAAGRAMRTGECAPNAGLGGLIQGLNSVGCQQERQRVRGDQCCTPGRPLLRGGGYRSGLGFCPDPGPLPPRISQVGRCGRRVSSKAPAPWTSGALPSPLTWKPTPPPPPWLLPTPPFRPLPPQALGAAAEAARDAGRRELPVPGGRPPAVGRPREARPRPVRPCRKGEGGGRALLALWGLRHRLGVP